MLTERIYLTDGGELEGPKHEFYYLWDQNENWKLIRGPNDLLSLHLNMLLCVHYNDTTILVELSSRMNVYDKWTIISNL